MLSEACQPTVPSRLFVIDWGATGDVINHAFGSLRGHSSFEDCIDWGVTGDVINHDIEARGRPAEPPLSISVHVANNFLRKLFTFVAWAPPPDFLFQIQEATLPKCC